MSTKRLLVALAVSAALAFIGYFVGLHIPLVVPAFVRAPHEAACFHAGIAGIVGMVLGFLVKDSAADGS